MHVRVTCAGILIGAADFEPASGVAHAALVTTPGYAFAADAAREIGQWLAVRQYWSPTARDFADEAAARWTGGRLALEDEVGQELGVTSIVVVERARGIEAPVIRVVADFRPDLARVEAFLRTLGPGGGWRRPAA